MDQNITLNVELSRENAATLLRTLNRRVEMLQGAENHDGSQALAELKQEEEAIIAMLIALEAAVKTDRQAGTPMEPIRELLSEKTSKLPSLVLAEEEARRALGQATESLAQAHAALATSLVSQRSAASAAIGFEETKLQRAQAAHDDAARRALEARAEHAEAG